MKTLWFNIQKELLLLRRDITGLLVIFLMPVVLVVVVTLVQQNVLKTLGEARVRTLFLDEDHGIVGPRIEAFLAGSGSIEVIKELNGKPLDTDTIRRAVAKGDFQFAVVVPEGTTKTFVDRAKKAARNSISVNKPKAARTDSPAPDPLDLVVYFDPALRENARAGIRNALERTLLAIETDEKMKTFGALLPKEVEAAARQSMGSAWSDEYKSSLPDVRIEWDKTPIMTIAEKTAQYGKVGKMPNTVQQNVPAWTLFGMFFIVVPLGGSLLRERQGEMLVRLLTMPQSCLTILGGKIISYLAICIVQFLVIIAVGRYLLPVLGTPVFEMEDSPAAMMLIAVSSGLAACGYGILLGTMARTYEQASTFGAVSVVIAAALGGIMVPVYVMPKVMQTVSLFSPLSWGLNAFLDVFVRGANLLSVMPDVVLLALFFLVTTAIAWFNLSRKGRIRIQ